MDGDLVEYGMMFNQTQTFLDDAEGQAEGCQGCKTKKNQACLLVGLPPEAGC